MPCLFCLKYFTKMNSRRKKGFQQRKLMQKHGSKLERIAALTGNPLAAVAVRFMRRNKNKKRMTDYIQSRGETPEQIPNNPELETLHQMGQYGELRNQQILEKQEELQRGNPQAGIPPEPNATYEDAHDEVLGYEYEMYGFDAYDADNFIPAIAGVVAKVGQKVGGAIQQSRAKKGKGVFWKRKGFQKAAQDVKKLAGKQQGEPETEVGKAVQQEIKQVEQTRTKNFLRDNMPVIVIAVVVLFGIAFMAGKNKS